MTSQAASFLKLARTYKDENLGLAIDAYCKALVFEPHNQEAWVEFAQAIRFAQFSQANPAIRTTLLSAFRQKINRQNLAVPAFSLLRLDPHFTSLLEIDFSTLLGKLKKQQLTSQLLDPLLIALLENVIVPDTQWERFLTLLRRAFLELLIQQNVKALIPLRSLLAALGMYCFRTEYLFPETPEETEYLNRLKISVVEEYMTAILGCYLPVYKIPQSIDFDQLVNHAPWLTLLLTMHLNPLLERALLKAKIPLLNPPHQSVSLAVQKQYEENPYPRWESYDELPPKSLQAVLQELFPQEALGSLPSAPKILVAGCGTGHDAIQTARLIQNSTVLAIDLSVNSLAYAKRMAAELGVSNISFMAADILDLASLGQTFDLIQSIGVLHHMEHPFEGWRTLSQMLSPNGLMNIGLYSKIGRQDAAAARALIAEQGYPPTLSGIRQCRERLFALPEEDPAKPVTYSIDFFSTSGCRDLIFNCQEHTFSLPEIEEMLKRLNLIFLGFEMRLPGVKQVYLQEYPTDPKAKSLENWTQFENDHPLTFCGMYQFWAKRSKT